MHNLQAPDALALLEAVFELLVCDRQGFLVHAVLQSSHRRIKPRRVKNPFTQRQDWGCRQTQNRHRCIPPSSGRTSVENRSAF